MSSKINLIELVQKSDDFLKRHGLKNSRLDAEMLISNYFNIKRLDIYLKFDKPVSKKELFELRKIIQRRSEHEPVQYIIGHTEFYGRNFNLTPDVLIPRPDTEILCETVLKHEKDDISLVDIGTGSGIIPITLKCEKPEWEVFALDISEAALEVAKKNAYLNQASVTFFKKDIFSNINKDGKKFDVIVSNPPYISKDEFETVDIEVKKYEPSIALTDEGDGLAFYKRLAEIAPLILKPKGRIYLEIGYNQADAVDEIFKEKFNFKNITKDYAGKDRVFSAKLK